MARKVGLLGETGKRTKDKKLEKPPISQMNAA